MFSVRKRHAETIVLPSLLALWSYWDANKTWRFLELELTIKLSADGRSWSPLIIAIGPSKSTLTHLAELVLNLDTFTFNGEV